MAVDELKQNLNAEAAVVGAAAADSEGENGVAILGEGGLPLSAAQILTNRLQSKVSNSSGFRRLLRGLFTLVPMAIVGAIGLAIVAPARALAWGLPLSPSTVELCAHMQLAGGALLAAGVLAAVLLILPWTPGRLLAAGSSYLLGLALVLYLLAGAVAIFVDGDFDVGTIALMLMALCAWAPGQAAAFAEGELQRVQLRAMLAAGDGAGEVGIDRPADWKRWVGRLLLALPVLGTGIAVLLWLGSVRGRPAMRCVCLGAQAFLAYLVAVTAAQAALVGLDGKLLGTYYPGGGAAPVDLDALVFGPAMWLLAAWCLLSAMFAVALIAKEVRAAGAGGVGAEPGN